MRPKKLLPFLSLLIFTTACVGTIEDTQLEKTKTAKTSVSKLPFGGLTNALPVSHNKVEVYFTPAPGEPEDITYQIFVNGSDTPIFVTGSSLTPNASGQLVYTVDGLQVNTTNSFTVSAINTAKGSVSDAGDEKYATTFGNQTADFSGIGNVRLPAGIPGQNSVIVEWVPAVSKGVEFSPQNFDPVAYEITYISEDGGVANLDNESYTGGDRVVSTFPSPITENILSDERTRPISGLLSGKTYYFRVRAIHRAYQLFGGPDGDPNYKREENNKFLAITTATPTGTFDFEPASAYAKSPSGKDALDSIDVIWDPATGDFDHYRIFALDVPASSDPDALTTADINVLDDSPANYDYVNSNATFHRLENLISYKPYQIKVVACGTALCAEADRIESVLIVHATHPTIAPFDGIREIDNPRSISDSIADRIYLNFNPPVVNTGYITDMHTFCVNDPSDYNPVVDPADAIPFGEAGSNNKIVRMTFGVQVATGGALPNCDDLTLDTDDPSSIPGFNTFEEISIIGAKEDVGNQYCFMLVPGIDGDNTYEYVDVQSIENGIVKCIVPVSQPPTLAQFPGKNQVCTLNERSIEVNWSLPEEGMFTNFEVFWREDKGKPFKYSEAIADTEDDDPLDGEFDPPYYSTLLTSMGPTILNDTATSYTIDDLIPGRRYFSGVLSYFTDGPVKKYSEFNLNTQSCIIPLPDPEWGEWMEIFAVGPKIDGMIPRDNGGRATLIVETLNDDGIPVEVLMDKGIDGIQYTIDDDPTVPYEDVNEGYIRDLNTSEFSGVYGAVDADVDNNQLFEFSNMGIVRIAWKDIKFYSGTMTMNDIIDIYENPDPGKNNRRFGYKVLRSDNDRLSWTDLTSSGFPNQKGTNAGLLVAGPYTWKKRNNATPITELDIAEGGAEVVVFTDYSVKAYEDNRSVDRARVYWYKIVPYFDGTPLPVPDDANVIRVTLPPPNMALVHRMMANRTICHEMDKTLNTGPGEYYSCDYNGVGSKGLNAPWIAGSTVYDLGGDLLVDRFEMGCNITRGSNVIPSRSLDSDPLPDFDGYTDSSQKFVGCKGPAGTFSEEFEPANGTIPPNADYVSNWDRVRPGDCHGVGSISLAEYGGGIVRSECSDPDNVNRYSYVWPGANGDSIYDCTNPSNSYWGLNDGINTWLDNTITDPDGYDFANNMAQSEFGAVYYHRSPGAGGYTQQRWPSAGNVDIVHGPSGYRYPSSCFVNLPGVHSSNTAAWIPRWIPLNRIFDDELSQGGSGITLYDKTIDEILADPQLYDQVGSDFTQPLDSLIDSTRYERDATPLAKIITSNNAKLPPVTLLSQVDMNNLCGLYSVDIGITNPADDSFVSLLQEPLVKRIARKKETIAMSAWPQNWTASMVNEIERGSGTGASRPFTLQNDWLYKVGGITFSDNDSACNTADKDNNNGQNNAKSDDIITTMFPHDSNAAPWVITGSSSLDPNGTYANTERCVSRFGIQDFVGNAAEYTTDEIFCNFSGEKIWYGVAGSQSSSISASDNGMVGRWVDNLDVTVWVLSGTETGKCSTVEWGAARAGAYNTGSIMNSIFDVGGGYNPAIVEAPKTLDQEGVLSTRNGDGFFMDWGQNNLGPPLAYPDIMGLGTGRGLAQNGSTNRPHYFNPATGLPLECPGTSCNTTLDNKAYTTAEQRAEFGDDPLNFVLPSFPINNSQIYNEGLRDIVVTNNFANPNVNQTPFYFIDNVAYGGTNAIDDDIINGLPKCPAIGSATGDAADGICWWNGTVRSGGAGPAGDGYANGATGGSVSVSSWGWKIPRNRPMQYIVGGRKNDAYAGRYHFKIVGRNQNTLRRTYGFGGRCVVMINEE